MEQSNTEFPPTVWVLLACKRSVYREEFKEVLERAGYGVEIVAHLTGVIDRVKFRHWDAIVVDLEGQLEEALGVTEVVRSMEAARGQPNTPVLGTVACRDSATSERAGTAGFDKVVQIDVTPHEIVHQVAGAVSMASATHAA